MIKNIQYLRFLAAFLVVCAHSNLHHFGVSASITNLGGIGVDIFFIISGFIMPYILFGGLYKQGSITTNSAAGFVWRRVARIWPMYLLATAAAVLLSYMVTAGVFSDLDADLMYAFNSSRLDLPWFIESVTFTHWERPPLLGVGWSLQVEFFFYIAIAFGLLVGARKLETLEIAISGFFFVFLILGSAHFTDSVIAQNFSNALIIEFMMGMFLYKVVSNGTLMNKYASVATIVLFFPVFIFIEVKDFISIPIPNLDRAVQSGFASFLLVWAAISLEGMIKEYKFIGLLGDASYSLYLTHAIVAPLYIFYMAKGGLSISVGPVIYLAGLLISCHVVAVAAHLYIEKPINSLLKKYTMNSRALVPA